MYSLAVNDSVSEAAQLGPGESLARIADSEYAPSSVSGGTIGPEHPVAACGSRAGLSQYRNREGFRGHFRLRGDDRGHPGGTRIGDAVKRRLLLEFL